MADINNQSRLSLSPAPNKRHSCPPISLHYGNKHRVSPAKSGSPMVKHYSPSVPNHFLRGSPQQACKLEFSVLLYTYKISDFNFVKDKIL